MSTDPTIASDAPRVFLVVVDDTPEHTVAVHYAARRAAHTGGRIAMLYVIEPADLQHWVAIEELARAERRETAEELLGRLCEEIAPIAGAMPIVYIREGRRRDELMALINEEPTISILVLAAGTSKEGPGPLVSLFTTGVQAIPVTIVPGNFNEEKIDQIA